MYIVPSGNQFYCSLLYLSIQVEEIYYGLWISQNTCLSLMLKKVESQFTCWHGAGLAAHALHLAVMLHQRVLPMAFRQCFDFFLLIHRQQSTFFSRFTGDSSAQSFWSKPSYWCSKLS